jgi:hypothetical protein
VGGRRENPIASSAAAAACISPRRSPRSALAPILSRRARRNAPASRGAASYPILIWNRGVLCGAGFGDRRGGAGWRRRRRRPPRARATRRRIQPCPSRGGRSSTTTPGTCTSGTRRPRPYSMSALLRPRPLPLPPSSPPRSRCRLGMEGPRRGRGAARLPR